MKKLAVLGDSGVGCFGFVEGCLCAELKQGWNRWRLHGSKGGVGVSVKMCTWLPAPGSFSAATSSNGSLDCCVITWVGLPSPGSWQLLPDAQSLAITVQLINKDGLEVFGLFLVLLGSRWPGVNSLRYKKKHSILHQRPIQTPRTLLEVWYIRKWPLKSILEWKRYSFDSNIVLRCPFSTVPLGRDIWDLV